MSRKAKFFTTMAVAIATFGTLMATLGPRHFGCHRGHHYYGHYRNCDHEKGNNCAQWQNQDKQCEAKTGVKTDSLSQ